MSLTLFDWAEAQTQQDSLVDSVVESVQLNELDGFKPREYQVTSESNVWREWDKGIRSTLGVMATGGGKTLIFGMVAKRAIDHRNGRVLVLAHREELLEQAAEKLAFVGVHSAIEKAQQKARKTIAHASLDYYNKRDIRCVIGSVQSMRGNRLESWPTDYFSHVIMDEGHHALANSYMNIFDYFYAAKFLLVTATPFRTDQQELGEICESVAFDYPLPWMIENNYLSKIVWSKSSEQIDLRAVNSNAQDLVMGDLEDAIGPHIERMVRAIKWKENGEPHLGERRAILFCPGRKSVKQKIRPCELFADGLRKVGISAKAIWGDNPDRIAIVRGFRANEFQVLCGTPSLLGEGVDFPFIEAAILGCPTKSTGLFSQMVGRCSRLSPETGKQFALVIDFDWLIDKHKLATPFSLVRPNGDDMEARFAAEIIASGEEKDILKAAALAERRARAERARLKELERERVARQKQLDEERKQAKAARDQKIRDQLANKPVNLSVRDGQSQIGFRQFDPFSKVTEMAGVRPAGGKGSDRPTDVQVSKLVNDFKIPYKEVMALDRQGAQDMIDWSFRRYEQGLAPLWLVRQLLASGVKYDDAMKYKQRQAFAVRDSMKGQAEAPWYKR